MSKRQPTRPRLRTALLAAVAAGTALLVGAAERYVATSGNNSDGSSWANAYTNLQTAIDAASPGDTIYLKGETFTLPINGANGKLYWGPEKHDLTIIGGYQGIGSEPGPTTNTATVLRNTAAATLSTNRVLYITGVTNGVLRNVTLQGGEVGNRNAQLVGGSWYGAGIYMTGCTNMLFDAVTVNANYAGGQQSQGTYGAGAYALNSYGVMTNCTFKNNTAHGLWTTHYGIGLNLSGGGWTVRDCVIRDNAPTSNSGYPTYPRGAGIYVASGTHTIKNCAITRNAAIGNFSSIQGEAITVANGTVGIENITAYWHPSRGIERTGGTVTLKNSIIWDCGDDIVGTMTLQNNCIQDGDSNGSNGNIATTPLFERGLYLSASSPCVNAGSVTAAEAGLSGYTTRADGTADTGAVDMGYHFIGGAVDYYVDAGAGSDSNDGLTAGTALKTITRALSLAADGSHVHVASGTYNTANGETFPLNLANRYGLQMLGTNTVMTIITPSGTTAQAITMRFCYPDASIAGLTVMGANYRATAPLRGAGLFMQHSQANLLDLAFRGNRAATTGWANPAVLGGGVHLSLSTGVMSNCVVSGNTATWETANVDGDRRGGGLYSDGGWTFLNSEFSSNTNFVGATPAYTLAGGGLYLDGNNVLRNCLIRNNKCAGAAAWAKHGDGVYIWGGTVLFENCTIVTNGGEGIRQATRSPVSAHATVVLRNSILWQNGDDLWESDATRVTKEYNTIEDGDGVGLNGNVQVAPWFVDPTGSNFRLALGSPCVNIGSNQTWMGSAKDLDGNARLDNDVVDLGCYEQVTPLRIVNRAAGNVTAASADFNGTLEAMGPHASVHLYVVWGPVNQTTNWDDWAYKTYLGTAALKGDISTNITFIGDSVTYFYAYVASNDTDIAWAQPSETILTEQIRVVATAPDAAELGTVPGTFTVYRSDAATDVPLTANFTLGGTAQNGVDYALITPSTVTIPIGATNATVTVTPLIDRWVEGSETVTLTLAPGSYVVGSPSSDTVTIADWTAPTALYVSAGGDGTYATNWSSGFATLQAALNNANAGDTVYVAGGTYMLASQIVWQATGVTIRGGYDGTGTPGEPSAATPTVLTQSARNRILYLDGVVGGRIENLTIAGGVLGHPVSDQVDFEYDVLGAGIYMTGCSNMVLSALTLRNNAAYVHDGYVAKGGGIYAANSWGAISNCLIRANVATRGSGTTTRGAGVCLEGGGWTITDSVIRDHTIPAVLWGNTCQGVGLSLVSGEHMVRNCLITRNLSSGEGSLQGGGIYVGSGTTTVANVTLYWNAPHGLYRNTAVVTVRDSILWDNGDDVAGTVTLINNAIEDGDANGVDGNIALNPLFERGLYLAANSPCIDAGSTSAVDAGVAGRTTQVGGMADTGLADMGYHFAAGVTDYFVDAVMGSDANTGTTAGSAFKTITKALATIGNGSRVTVAAGTYDTANGEIFPLTVSQLYGIQIRGAGRNATIIDANGANQRCLGLSYVYPGVHVSDLTLTRGRITALSSRGGGLYLTHVQGLVVACDITDNELPNPNGWGGPGGGGLAGILCRMTISNCLIARNSVTPWYPEHSYGGGIFADNLGDIVNCTIVSNVTSVGGDAYGEGQHAYGGGLYISGNTTVRNSLITHNDAKSTATAGKFPRGDAAYIAGGTVAFENCTVVTNHPVAHARGGDAYTGGLGIERGGGTVTLRNSILWGNGDDIIGTVALRFSNIEDGDSVGVDGNISEYPLFVDPAGGDWRLQVRPVRSPSLNAGEYQAWMDGASDLDGNPRILNKVVDMGAYEALIPAGGTVLLLR